MLIKKQAGFGVVPIIVIIAAIAVLGFVGFRLLTTQSSKPATNNATAHTQTSPASNQPSNTQTSATPAQTDTYLHIKELGIKIKLSDGIKDAVYSMFQPQPDDGAKVIGISAQSLIDSSAVNKQINCSASSGALGIITETTTAPTYVGGQEPFPVDNKSLFKFGSTYYQYQAPQTQCGISGPGYEALQQSMAQKQAAFAEAFKTVQLDN
jgi:hypothetical protein